jgi:L-lactate utilization protein LutC
MALNLADRLVVIQSPAMQTRVTAAVAKYALYLLGGSPTVNQLAWAREAIRTPAEAGRQVAFHVLDDTNFLAGGSDITDAQLQGAVEAAVNARFVAA